MRDPEPSPSREERGCSPESDLIRRAQAGERAALEELLRAHYVRVHALAFRLLGNPEDAEDLAQEGFVRAFRSLAFYRGDGSFAAWLRRIVVHLAQDRFRARGKPASLPLGVELAGGRDPRSELEGRELHRAVDDALLELNATLRMALLLRTREGLEYEEIASATRVTPATARTRVMKARKALLRVLAPHLAAFRGELLENER